jgi:hypothetical protein
MLFIIIALAAIILYIREYKILALILLFFLLTSGFNLIPEEVFDIGFISKGSDYAFLILFGIVIIDILCIKKYLQPDDFSKYLLIFALFVLACVLYNRFAIHLEWSEIIRNTRYLFFWMAYFVFRNMERIQLERVLKYLFLVTVFLSVLFLLQQVVKENILLEKATMSMQLLGIDVIRFYNQPDMLHFFTFMAVYLNPYKGIKKHITTLLLVTALFGAFHRSLIGFFILAVAIGYILRLSRLQRIKIMTVSSILLLFVIVFVGSKFVKSKTYVDLQLVASGDFANVGGLSDIGEGASFTFRLAHLFERNQYLWEHPVSMIFGAGLFSEESKNLDKFFDFKIGLIEELTGGIAQMNTPDISYSTLFLRFGYVGTFLNLLLFIYLMIFFYKKRENKYGLFSFLYLILTFGISFFSANLVSPVTFLLPLISYQIIQKTESEDSLNKNNAT